MLTNILARKHFLHQEVRTDAEILLVANLLVQLIYAKTLHGYLSPLVAYPSLWC